MKIRLIDVDGTNDIVEMHIAKNKATAAGLDLIPVSPNANPPVYKIMDHGKLKYEQGKRKKNKGKKVQTKEVKFSPRIERGDFETKIKQIRRFLDKKHKVKCTLWYRGREMAHKELGLKVLDRVAEELGEDVKIDQLPSLQGRSLTMLLAPLQ